MGESENKKNDCFIKGVKAGIPVAIGYIPIAIAFGLIAKLSNVPNLISILMSFSIFAGASQFIGVNLIAAGATSLEIVVTTFILNFRHFLMSSSLSQRIIENTPKKILSILAFGITDETFAVASLRNENKLAPEFVLGINVVAFTSWNIGTWIGIFLGVAMPKTLQSSMGIALYAMFIGLLVPSLKKSKPILIVSAIAIAINSLIFWAFDFISIGWSIIISTVLSAALGAALFKEEEIE